MAVLKTGATQRDRRNVNQRFWFWLLAGCFAAVLTARAQIPVPREYQVKAVFLFNFAQFVDWPASAFTNATAPIVIGILGEDPYGDYLDEAVRGEKLNDRPLVVQRYHKVEDLKPCQILYISSSESSHLAAILKTLKGQHTLTVSDAPEFDREGGMIGFVTEKNKIRLHIDRDAALAEQLKISSRLLRLAQVSGKGADK